MVSPYASVSPEESLLKRMATYISCSSTRIGTLTTSARRSVAIRELSSAYYSAR